MKEPGRVREERVKLILGASWGRGRETDKNNMESGRARLLGCEAATTRESSLYTCTNLDRIKGEGARPCT